MKIPPISAASGAFLAMVAVVLLPSCVGFRAGRGDDPGRETGAETIDLSGKQVFLGNVSLVNEGSQFVLIKTPVNQRLEPGTALQSFRGGELSGELLFSPEQSYGYMVADIALGAPAAGDGVYLKDTEGVEAQVSPRMQQAMDQYELEKNMGPFEKRRYERQKRRELLKKKRRG